MVLMLPLPKWVGILGSAIALLYTLIAGMRLSDSGRSPLLWAAWMAFAAFALPWADQMYVFDFQLNYLWAGALSLLALQAALRGHLALWRAAILGLAAGAWHEGFSIPLFCAIAVLMLREKRLRTGSNAWMMAGLAAGIIFLVSAPATARRLEWTPWFASRAGIVVLYALPPIAYIVASGIALLTRQRIRAASPVNCALLTAASVSCAISLATMHGPRVGWFGILASGIGLAYLAAGTKIAITHGACRSCIAAAVMAAVTVHLVAVDRMCFILGREMDAVLAKWQKNPEATVFHDLTLRCDAPAICLQRPYYDWFAHLKTAALIGKFHGHSGNAVPRVVPVQLESYSSDTEAGDIAIHGKYMVGPATDSIMAPHTVSAMVDFGGGLEPTELYAVPFISAADGRTYVWYYPNSTSMQQMLGAPVDARRQLR